MNDWQIIIADRGWVYVGKPQRDGEWIVIHDCYNVMRWGTTRGLGQLALEGPTKDTKLDLYGIVKVHVLAIAGGTIECDNAIWSKWFTAQKRGAK